LAHLRQQRADGDVVDAEHRPPVERHPVDELEVRIVHPVHVTIEVEVLAIDVGHHREDGRQQAEGPIALVRLGPQELALAEPRAARAPWRARARARRWGRGGAAWRRPPRGGPRRPPRGGGGGGGGGGSCRAAPATATPDFMRISSASISARGITGMFSSRAAT